MPSPITTAGFDSPVMPAVQLANPVHFGGIGQQIGSGLSNAVAAAGELQRQRQLAAMNPVALQIAQQQAEQGRRMLLAPNLVPVGEQVLQVARPEPPQGTVPAGNDAQAAAYNKLVAEGVDPDVAAKRVAAEVPYTPPPPAEDQYKLTTYRDVNTGQIVQRPTLYQTAEQVAEAKAMAEQKLLYGQYLLGRNPATIAAAAARQTGQTKSALGADGRLHIMERQADPQTGAITYSEGPIDLEGEARIAKANADASRSTAQAGAVGKEHWTVEQDPDDPSVWHNVMIDAQGVRHVSEGVAAPPASAKKTLADIVKEQVAQQSGTPVVQPPKARSRAAASPSLTLTVPGLTAPMPAINPNPEQPVGLPPSALSPAPQVSQAPALSEQDQQALAWAQQNPQDPRAAIIRSRLGL